VFEGIYYILNKLLTIFLIIAPTTYLLIVLYAFRKELKKSVVQIIFFLFLTTIFLNKLLFTSQSLAQKDFNNIQIPLMNFFTKSITKNFSPPIWNSSFCGGFDAFSNPLSVYFSVFNWVFLLGTNTYFSYALLIFVQIFLCLVGSYLMLRSFSFSKMAAVLGAVVFSFNGFVTMRLSPGVGIEYLFAYKWVPFILAFSKRFFEKSDKLSFLGLSISLAFLLEGNPSIAIATYVFWGIFVLFNYKKLISQKFKILFAPLVSFLIYALKILPVLDLFKTGGERFEGAVGSWRASNFDTYMFPEAFLPIKSDFTNGVFTPGALAISLFFAGVLLSSYSYIRKRKEPFRGFYFVNFIFILAFFITIENPIYYLLYSFPVLNRVTIIPSFLIFYLIPIAFFAAYGFSVLCKFVGKYKIVLIVVPLAIFGEVLFGPSTFGNDSYSFNFAKIDYAKEIADFPHYNVLKDQKEGLFFINDYSHVFIYPYAISTQNLKTLNFANYFFGCREDEKLISGGTEEMINRADYILSLREISNSNLELIDKVSMSGLRDHKSHAVFERMMDYYVLYETLKDIGWNDDMYVYKVGCTEGCSIKNLSDNPVNFSIKADSGNKNSSGNVITSINYSKWLKVKKEGKFLQTYRDDFGYLEIEVGVGDLEFFYVNPYIYVGFILSLFSFVFVVRSLVRK